MKFSCVLVSLIATSAFAAQISTPATKDSTIIRSSTGCSTCPENNCNKCLVGHENKLQASASARTYIRTLVGFKLPVDPERVTECTLQIPAFSRQNPYSLYINIGNTVSSDWDEDTVNGENAPDSTSIVTTVSVPANTNLGPVNITSACKNADCNGEFSVYLGTTSGSFEFWSKDSGNPAILHIQYD